MMIRPLASLRMLCCLLFAASPALPQTNSQQRPSPRAGAGKPKGDAQPSPRRGIELQLARLRPGVSHLADAEKLYPAHFRLREGAAESQPVWADGCTGRLLRLELSDAGGITSITVTAIPGLMIADCASYTSTRKAALKSALWTTGRGLRLGDPLARVLALYGAPASRAPSTQAGLDLELLYYEFDWAGPDVPQVMEISCDRKTGRVLQMTLSFPSL